MFLLLAVAISVQAGSVHKWVDAQGVTHYSDRLPKNDTLADSGSGQVEVTQITISDEYRSQDYQNDYYSVTNQWARMKEERIARKQLQLEKAKQKASQRPAVPQVVYVNEEQDSRSNGLYFPAHRVSFGSSHRGYGIKRYRYPHYAGKKLLGNNYGATCELPRRGFSKSINSGLSLTFH